MGELLSKISGQLAGPILLGSFFPVVLFLTALALVVLPITPYGHGLTNAVQDPAVWQKNPMVALVATIIVLVLSVVLYNVNVLVVRLYEGYPWQYSFIGQGLRRRRTARLKQMSTLRERIRSLRKTVRLGNIEASKEVMSQAIQSQRLLAQAMNDTYPYPENLVMPTRLGNVIRSFESYTTRMYGVTIIALWPRLVGVLDGAYAQSLDAAKTSFDFMIHSAFLSGVLAFAMAACGLYWRTPLTHSLWDRWLAWTVAFTFLSYLFYVAAIYRAKEWGTQVKAAFDLYRGALLTKLGYELKPANLTEEKRIWDVLNYKFSYPDERTYADLPYKVPSSYWIVDPASTILTSFRTVVVEDGALQVHLVVSNVDPSAFDADRVILREEVPSGKVYVRDSATVNGAPARLLGTDPVQIDIGPLPYYETRTVEYKFKAP